VSVASADLDAADGGALESDTLALVGTAAADGTIHLDLASVTDQLTGIGETGNETTLAQINFEHVDASGLDLGSRINVTGSDGANVLTGSSGVDTMAGGLGNDTYVIQSNTDQVTEENVLNGGTDTVIYQDMAADYVLAANVENLILQGEGTDDLEASGNNLANTIQDNSGATTSLFGLAGSDMLFGGSGDDTLSGGTEKDTLVGGEGDDVYELGAANGDTVDVLVEAPNGGDEDRVVLNGISTYTLLANFEQAEMFNNINVGTLRGNTLDNLLSVTAETGAMLDGGAGNDSLDSSGGTTSTDTLVGGTGNDTLVAGNGNDTLTGGAGTDSMLGGAGNDLFLFGAAAEIPAAEVVDGGADTDTLRYTGGAATLTFGAGQITLTSIEAIQVASATGSIIDIATINVNAANHAGPLSISGNNGVNMLTGTTSNDSLAGNGGNDILVGGDGNDSMEGGAGNDTVIGGADDDFLQGGDGNDVFLIGQSEHGAAETLDGGAGTGDIVRFTSTTDNDTLTLHATNLEQVTIGTAAGVIAGITRLHVDASDAGGVLLIAGNNGANDLTGNGLNNSIIGNGGNDTLTGGAGNDVLNGGVGTDTADYSGAVGSVGANLLLGTAAQDGDGFADTLVAIENVTGSANNDTLTGNAGNNVLMGGVGNDVLNGGAGIDTADYSDAVGNVIVDLLVGSAEGAAGSDSLALIENITGSGNNDTLIGNAGANVLDGGVGNDSMTGGAGNDTYLVSQEGETVTEGAGVAEGLDTVIQQNMTYSYTLAENVENLTILASESGQTATGNDLNNLVLDSSGSGLTLIGGTGKDTLMGGIGDDTYVLNVTNGATMATGDLGDVLVEAAGQGTDSVHLRGNNTVQTFTFIVPTQIEKVFVFSNLGASTVTLTGNALDNEFSAVSMPGGAALFDGGSGNDTLLAGAGNDNLKGGTGNDSLEGRSGNDTLTGGAGIDGMSGQEGDDIFLIGAGTEHLGSETMNGGLDSDTIRFTSIVNGDKLILTNNVIDVERVVIGNAAESTIGTTTLEVNAAAVGNALDIIGNNGANKLTGTAFTDTLVGNGGNDILIGGAGNDTLAGGAGADNQQGGLGDDLFQLFTLAEFAAGELIDGGADNDTLQIAGSNQVLNLVSIANNRITGIEVLDITGSGDNTLTLNLADVLDLSFTTNTLRVDGDANDVVNSAGQGWTVGAEQLAGYTTYTFGAATLLIDTDITQNIN
jgi:trimeric autotransporter adhesin